MRVNKSDLQWMQIKLGKRLEKRKYSKTRQGKNVFGRKDRRRWPRCRRCGWKGHNSATCAIVDVEKDGNPFRQEHWDQIELDRKVGNAIQGARRQADARVKAIRRMREREKDAQRREKIKEKKKNDLIKRTVKTYDQRDDPELERPEMKDGRKQTDWDYIQDLYKEQMESWLDFTTDHWWHERYDGSERTGLVDRRKTYSMREAGMRSKIRADQLFKDWRAWWKSQEPEFPAGRARIHIIKSEAIHEFHNLLDFMCDHEGGIRNFMEKLRSMNDPAIWRLTPPQEESS